MPFQISPAVNVSEIDLTTVIPVVSTTEGGIAGHFKWGPCNKAILVDSEDTLFTNFQGPNANTYKDFFTAANFLAYGNKLHVVRVINKDAQTVADNARNSHGQASNTQTTLIENDEDYENNHSSGISGVGQWVAKYPGVLGNSLKVSVCPSSNAWQRSLTGNIAVTTNTAIVTGKSTLFTTQLVVGSLLVVGADREMKRVSAITNATYLTLDSRYTGNTVTMDGTHSATPLTRWEFFNYFTTAPGTSEYANTVSGVTDEMHIAVIDEDGLWTGVKNTVLERFEKVSAAQDALTENGSTNYYKNVINQQSRFVWWAAHNSNNTNAGKNAQGVTFGGQNIPQSSSLVNGRDGAKPTSGDYINGFNKFRNTEDIDVSLLLGAAANQTIALHLINNIAEVRKDCLVCLSPREADVVNNSGYSGSEVDDIITFRNLLPSSSYAVIDSGWKWQYDKYNDVRRAVPCNGDTAGLMVYTDTVRDPWFSPAGFNRGNVKNVLQLTFNPRKAERDMLYKSGINPIVSFPGQGTVLFGDKTMLNKPSAFDRINVRRLFIVLEKAIATASRFTLFEFNDEFTRASFRNLVEPFLRDVQGRRGIYDYRVVCDETNNTGEVIDRNEFVGDIYIKPARSINYIQLNFVAVRTGVDFEEVVGKF